MSITTSPGLFSQLPTSLRTELISAFHEIEKNYREHRWEPSELNGGKLGEVVYSILNGHITGTYPAKATKPKRFNDACTALESAPPKFSHSVRVSIPRALIVLYDVRNSRSVGHVGGDVDPNYMDATLVMGLAKWVVAELVRIFHGVDTATATKMVEGITERTLPIIWEVGDVKRVLNTALPLRDATLLLIYSATAGAVDRDLARWLEVSRLANYRRVLGGLHKDRLVEYDTGSGEIRISPTGSEWVEKNLLK